MHVLLVAKKMHDEGDCISDDEITIVFYYESIRIKITQMLFYRASS